MSRILIATNIFPPLIGGPATFADRLAHVLAGRGHKVTVVCSSSAATDPGDAARPFRVVRVSTANRYVYEVKIRAALVREFATHKRILVAGLESYVLDAARIVPRRYVLRVPGDTVWESARNYGVTTLPYAAFQDAPLPQLVVPIAAQRRAYMARASVIVAPSRHLAGLIAAWLPGARDLRVIENGVALADYPERPWVPRGDRPLRALFVGRLTNAKGVETILLAARELPGVEVAIIGDGPELPMLAALLAQLGAPPHIALLGRLSAGEVKAHMARSDVFLLPTENEGMSNALLEACASGLAPIASRIPSNLEVVADGASALLHDYGDVSALKSAIARLAGDEALLRSISVAARSRAADFPFDRTVDAYARLIEEQGA